jgi:chemotaxis protein CheD
MQENPTQLQRIAWGFGRDLEEVIASGMLTLMYISPVDIYLDEFVSRVTREALAGGVQRLLVDSINDLHAASPGEGRFRDFMYSLTQAMAVNGVSVFMTNEIGDLKVSADAGDLIVTHALGSCIAVMVHDPVRVAGGMIHYMLPLSETSPEKARVRPAMFADTGIPALFHALYAMGCRKQDLVVKVAGGGALYDDNGLFRIGERNHLVLRRMLWKNGILIADEDVGGTATRTLTLEMATGRTTVKTGGTTRVLHPGTEGSTR